VGQVGDLNMSPATTVAKATLLTTAPKTYETLYKNVDQTV